MASYVVHFFQFCWPIFYITLFYYHVSQMFRRCLFDLMALTIFGEEKFHVAPFLSLYNFMNFVIKSIKFHEVNH